MKYIFIILVLTLGFYPSQIFAQDKPLPVVPPPIPSPPYRNSGNAVCELKERVQLEVVMALKSSSVKSAIQLFEEKTKKIEGYAKDQNVKLERVSEDYRVSSNPKYGENGQVISYEYGLDGNSSYKVDNSVDGLKMAEFLDSQKIQVRYQSSTYQDCR